MLAAERPGMAETEVSGSLLGSAVELVRMFAEIATGDPVQALLLLVGALIIGFTSAVFGVLAVGGLLSGLGSLAPSGRAPPRRE